LTYFTEEEVRAAKQAAMPAPLGDIHFALWKEVVWLHFKWNEYRTLFASSPEEIELLNATAPALFYQAERALWQDILLHLCRMTDRPTLGKHRRLSLSQLPSLISDPSFRAEVESLVNVAKDKVNLFARGWRDRRFAHEDFPPLDGGQPQPLPSASRNHVEDALAAIREVMNYIEVLYENHSPVPYERVIEPLGGAASLLFYLKKGLESQRKEDEKWLARKLNRQG
jgi:hypothetical protein